jgi:hypothetical protein
LPSPAYADLARKAAFLSSGKESIVELRGHYSNLDALARILAALLGRKPSTRGDPGGVSVVSLAAASAEISVRRYDAS